jgi:hypothetical protein
MFHLVISIDGLADVRYGFIFKLVLKHHKLPNSEHWNQRFGSGKVQILTRLQVELTCTKDDVYDKMRDTG